MKNNSSPALALVPAGIFFCLALQAVHFLFEKVVRDVCLLSDTAPSVTLKIITAVPFFLVVGIVLLLIRRFRRTLNTGGSVKSLVLQTGLAYLLVFAAQFGYTYWFYDNVLIDAQGYVTTLKAYVGYMDGLSSEYPVLVVMRKSVLNWLVYLLVVWRCLST